MNERSISGGEGDGFTIMQFNFVKSNCNNPWQRKAEFAAELFHLESYYYQINTTTPHHHHVSLSSLELF